MKEIQIMTRIKRIRDRGNTYEPDSEKGPGDLYYITKYLSDNKIMIGGNWGSPQLMPGQVHLHTNDSRRIYGDPENKAEIIKVYEQHLKDLSGWQGANVLVLGEHTYFPAAKYKTRPYWVDVRFTYDRPKNARKVPIVKLDYSTYIPEDLKGEDGGFEYTVDNIKKLKEYIDADTGSNVYASLGYCSHCRVTPTPGNMLEENITKIVRKSSYVFLDYKCSGCGSPMNISVAPTGMPEPHIHSVSNVIAQLKLSDDYYVERRITGYRSNAVKLKRVGMDNQFPFTHNNWGRALLTSTMAYAKKLKIPIEVEK